MGGRRATPGTEDRRNREPRTRAWLDWRCANCKTASKPAAWNPATRNWSAICAWDRFRSRRLLERFTRRRWRGWWNFWTRGFWKMRSRWKPAWKRLRKSRNVWRGMRWNRARRLFAKGLRSSKVEKPWATGDTSIKINRYFLFSFL